MVFKLSRDNQVVARYELAIVGLFVAILLASLSLATYRYIDEIDAMEAQELKQLSQKAAEINNELDKAEHSLNAMQRFANYSLSFPGELASAPQFKQDGQAYYLDKIHHDFIEHRQNVSVNITGLGDISAPDDNLQYELAMANMLTPAFITAQNNVTSANWFYYLSNNKFISLYPWIDRKNWQYSDRLLQRQYFLNIRNTSFENKVTAWSDPYVGTSGKSLYVAVAKGVFRRKEFTGALVINLDLSKLYQQLMTILDRTHNYALINNKDQLLVHLNANSSPVNTVKSWQTFLPKSLSSLSYSLLSDKPASFEQDGWLVQHHNLPINGWMLVKYQPYQNFSSPIFQRFLAIFTLLFMGQLSLLVVIYLVTRQTFIGPTQQFISHISHSAKGDHGKISPPTGWQQWFNIVADIFSENRSLLQQLKDQNNILDNRVAEKTQALFEKSEQHQHDYAILRSVMNAIPDYLIFNDVYGKVIGCNLAFEQFVQINEARILGANAGDLVDSDLGKALKHIANSSDTSVQRGIFQVIKTTDKIYELFTSNFYSTAQELLGNIVIIRDVTEQHNINSALALAKEQAESANRAKNQFLANMSHEIRTPINAIQGMQSLLNNTALTPQQLLHLQNAQNASDALLYLVDELLDLAKIESGNMSIVSKQCSLDNIVNQSVRLNSGNINSTLVELNVNIAAKVPLAVMTDEMRLVQVLSNLLNNAIKFTQQGSISLSVDVESSDKNQSLVRFSVADTGIGIAKENQSRLFEAFIQADETMTREYGGSGLGLSICQHIIKLLGGEITLISEIGIGTTLSFTIPLKLANDSVLNLYQESANAFVLTPIFTAEFNTLLSHYHYDIHRLNKLSAIKDYDMAKVNVLFMDMDDVTDENCRFLSSKVSCAVHEQADSNRCVVAICEGTTENDNANQAYELLDSYHIPYVMCELPLYRFTLTTILNSLNARTQEYEKITKSDDKNVTSEHSKQTLAGTTVLLAEDNIVNQMVATELLKSMGADVIVAENGQEAIECIKNQTFDVVLMDIQMPVMDGLTATKIIRENEKYAHLPIIAMTAHARQEDKDKSIQAGMNLHVAKPVKAEVLLASILMVIAD